MNPHLSTKEPGTEKSLPGLTHSRNWLAGSAIAAGSIGVPHASAGLVQITQGDDLHFTTATLPRESTELPISSDFTRDGFMDMANLFVRGSTVKYNYPSTVVLYSRLYLFTGTNQLAFAFRKQNDVVGTANDKSRFFASAYGTFAVGGTQPQTKEVLFGITFRDTRINNGAETEAAVEILCRSDPNGGVVEIVRLIFDDESTTLTGASVDQSYPEWETPTARAARLALIASIESKAKKLKRKAAKTKRKGPTAKAKRLLKKAKSLLARARSLKR